MLQKPKNPRFGSGPTRKTDLWESMESIGFKTETIGTSHRGKRGVSLIKNVQSLIRQILLIPETHEIGFVSGGGTGAMEFLLWNLLGTRTVDVFSAGIFGNHWITDIKNELKITDINIYKSDFARSPNFSEYNINNDCVFVWHETTAGTIVPNCDWLGENKKSLTICDATSAVFCSEIPWDKIDATAFSWQKGIGGEPGIGTVVMNKKAISHLANDKPWAIPRLFRIKKNEPNASEINLDFFDCKVINTMSLLLFQDMFISLQWAKNIGGLDVLLKRVKQNFACVKSFIEKNDLLKFLVEDASYRSEISVCLEIGRAHV